MRTFSLLTSTLLIGVQEGIWKASLSCFQLATFPRWGYQGQGSARRSRRRFAREIMLILPISSALMICYKGKTVKTFGFALNKSCRWFSEIYPSAKTLPGSGDIIFIYSSHIEAVALVAGVHLTCVETSRFWVES